MEDPTNYYKEKIVLLKKALKEAIYQRDKALSLFQGRKKELDDELIKISDKGDSIIQSILNGEHTNGI